MRLVDGSSVAVVGGGPAGSLFSYFLLKLAHTLDLDLAVDIFEPRFFSHPGPGGCNHCGGIISETLVQLLAAEGVRLPPTVVQRGIFSYELHMDVGRTLIRSPADEHRIASVYRGNGPRDGDLAPKESFDGFLLQMAVAQGATIVRRLVVEVDRSGALPRLVTPDQVSREYDLVCVASGVNSNFLGLSNRDSQVSPKRARTFICEFRADVESVDRLLGESMHVFLLDLPRLEFAALIPKMGCVTLAMLGRRIDQTLIDSFLRAPEVRAVLPLDDLPVVCTCCPMINLAGPPQPFADRIVLIGDAGVTRLYKDGIGAAYRTAKAAAQTALLSGVSADDFRRSYLPICRSISADNAYGRMLFTITHVFRKSRLTRRAVLHMTSREQQRAGKARISSVLWNLFTGSAPYRQIFLETLLPSFVASFLRSLLVAGVKGPEVRHAPPQ